MCSQVKGHCLALVFRHGGQARIKIRLIKLLSEGRPIHITRDYRYHRTIVPQLFELQRQDSTLESLYDLRSPTVIKQQRIPDQIHTFEAKMFSIVIQAAYSLFSRPLNN